MKLYQKKWWKDFFNAPKNKKIDSLESTEAIRDFILDIDQQKEDILKVLADLEELQKEGLVSKEGLMHVNINSQVKLMDQLIEKYEFLKDDVDVNALRIKMLAKDLIDKADKVGMRDLVNEKKKDMKWKFNW